MIRKLSEDSLKYLLDFYNLLFKNHIFPNKWKEAIIIPILKPGKNKFEIGSYRPINISHPIDKLYQEFVKNHLLSFLNVNNII